MLYNNEQNYNSGLNYNSERVNYISLNDQYNSPAIALDKLVNAVEIPVVNFVARASSEEIHKSVVAVSGTQDVWVEYNNSPCQDASAVVSGGTLNSGTYYASAALLNITASGNVTITVTGKVMDKSEAPYTLVDTESPTSENPLTLKINSNSLVTDSTLAANTADWILTEVKKRYLYDVNWRQNAAIEPGDELPIEDDYTINRSVRITKQELNYQGYLGGKSYGKG